MKQMRRYEQVGNLAVETDYVEEEGTGAVLKIPVDATKRKIVSVAEVKALNLPLVQTVGTGMAGMAGADHKSDYNHSCGCNGHEGQILELDLNLSATAGTDGIARIGLHDDGYNLFPTGVVAGQDVTVGGYRGADTLQVLGQLAQHGTFKVTKIYAAATDQSFFGARMVLKGVKADGTSTSEKAIQWTKASGDSENTTIRENVFPGGLVLTGMNYLEIPTKGGTGADITVYGTFTPYK
jgi:hypothetical protein